MYPENLRYTKEHEWVEASGTEVRVGVTFFAQKELGDIVFIELPDVGRALKAGEEFGTVESVKAVSELTSPVSGEVTAVNTELEDHPEIVNEDPYDKGWMLKLRLSEPSELESLMDAAAYQKHIGEQEG